MLRRCIGVGMALFLSIIAFCGLVFGEGGATGSAWSSARGDFRNTGRGKTIGPNSISTDRKEPIVEWGIRIGKPGSGMVVGHDGTLYITMKDANYIIAINGDGSLKWAADIGEQTVGIGAVSAQEVLYIVGESGNLFAIDLSNGRIQWKVQVDCGTKGSPVIREDDAIYVIGEGVLAAVSTEGRLMWSRSVPVSSGILPAFDGNETLYIAGEGGKVSAINVDGTLIWEKSLFDEDICGPIVIDEAGNIYVAGCKGSVLKANTEGETIWKYGTGETLYSTPSLGYDGSIYISGGRSIQKIDGEIGKRIWVYGTKDEVVTTPLVDAEGNVYVGAIDGTLYAINDNGTERWNFNLNSGGYEESAIMDEDGTLYFSSIGRWVHSIKKLDGHFEVLGKPGASPATMHDWTICPKPGGGELLVITFRRDGFVLVVDLQTGEVHQDYPPGMVWSITTGPDGKVYMGTSESPGAHLLRYDPEKDVIEDLGRVESETTLYWLATAPDGRIYGGTYPNALLIRYNVNTGQIENLGRMADDQMYNIAGAIGEDGLIYCGLGMERQGLIEYNPMTGEKRDIWPESWATSNSVRVFKGSDDLVYAYPGVSTSASEGLSLQIYAGGQVKEVTKTPPMKMGANPPTGAAPVELSDGWKLIGVNEECVALQGHVGENGVKERIIPLNYEGRVREIFSMGMGPGGIIYASSKPTVLVSYDPKSGKVTDLKAAGPDGAQIGSMGGCDGKLYMGTYGNAVIHVFDPSNPSKGSRTIGAVGEYQNRVRGIVGDSNGIVYMGTYPGYGEYGGAVCYLDTKSESFETYRYIIPNQSIQSTALDEENGLLYLGSSIQGGNGTAPVETEAVVAEWDIKKREIRRQVVPVENAAIISALISIPDGLLCGITNNGIWFGIDKETFEVLFKEDLGYGSSPHLASLGFDKKKNAIYGIAGRTLFTVSANDPSRVESIAQYPAGSSIATGVLVDEYGAVYFAHGTELIRWVPE